MGDRANVQVVSDDDSVFLYSHWGGTELLFVLQNALSRRVRWDDHAYLARIIFGEMVKDDVLGELSYGISSSPPDGGDRTLRVDCVDQTVSWVDAYEPDEPAHVVFTFEEFIEDLILDEFWETYYEFDKKLSVAVDRCIEEVENEVPATNEELLTNECAGDP